MKKGIQSGCTCVLAIFYATSGAAGAAGYAFNEIVPDVHKTASISEGSACPVRPHIRAVASARAVQWSTALGTNPLTIITQDQTPNGRLAEIEQVVTQSLGVWSGVKGSTLQTIVATVTRTTAQNACGPDGVNSICFNQADLAFTPGVLAFTRVITADRIGVQFGSGAPSSEVERNFGCGYLFQSERFTHELRDAASVNCHAGGLRYGIDPHARDGTCAGLQPFGGVERDDVSVCSHGWHI
jgi:hypothetical protein